MHAHRGIFDDLDAFVESASDWGGEFTQLDRGPFRGELVQAGFAEAQFLWARFNRRIEQEGAPPRGLRSFVVPATPDQDILWRSSEIHGDDLAAFPLGGELYSISRPGFEVYAPSFSEELLRQAAGTLGLSDVIDRLSGQEVVACWAPTLGMVRKRLERLHDAISAARCDLDTPALRHEFEFEVPRDLIMALATSCPEPEKPPAYLRSRAIQRARAAIAECADQPLVIGDLCRICGASERTLQYAFREHYGITPKAYLQARRLNGVRRQLCNASLSEMKVCDAANARGFWHMGQFAADYRLFFGELPSETLRGVVAKRDEAFSLRPLVH